MSKTRAIYIEDINFPKCPVYELNPETGYFEMLEDKTFRFKEEEVKEDDNWLVFEVDKLYKDVLK